MCWQNTDNLCIVTVCASGFKWKISFNENAKNTAWWNELIITNLLVGPVIQLKSLFAVIDLRSSFDRPRISERFDLTDRLLSGQRPAAHNVQLHGESTVPNDLRIYYG